MSDRIQYFVQQTGEDRWELKRAKAQRATKLFDTKTEALDYSRDFVRNSAPGTLVIKGQDGLIQEQHNYDEPEIDEDAETVMEATGEALKSGAATAAATGQRVKEAMARTAEKASDTSGARLSAACRAAAIPLATAAIAWFGTVQLLQLAFSGNRGTSS